MIFGLSIIHSMVHVMVFTDPLNSFLDGKNFIENLVAKV